MTSKNAKKPAESAAKKPRKLSPSEVKAIVLEALSDEGSYREMPTLHSSFDHPDRKIDFNDILLV